MGMGCAEGCRRYELTRDLDFKSAGSYASGAVNETWTSRSGWLPIVYTCTTGYNRGCLRIS